MRAIGASCRAVGCTMGAAVAVCWLLLANGTPAHCDERFELNERALAALEFDGHQLPATLEAFKQQYPQATVDATRGDEKAGLVCYTVTSFPHSDKAQFFFCDERLYQFETQYSLPLLEKMGGAKVLLNKLLAAWGPADHAGESRWTWQRPMYSRRADFYAWPEKAKLTITDTAWTPVVTARLSKSRVQPPGNLGF